MQVLVVEDVYLVRRGTVALINDLRPEDAVRDVGSLHDAFEVLKQHPDTDLILLDLELPGESAGIETFHRVRKWCDDRDLTPCIVVQSVHDDPTLVAAVLEESATGFITKLSINSADNFRDQLGAALDARPVMSRRAADALSAGGGRGKPSSEPEYYPKNFTECECDACDYVYWGLSYKQMAQAAARGVAPETLRKHVKSAADKLGISENPRAGLVAAFAEGRIKSRLTERPRLTKR
jgi:DNA-binding NarL/FixJ family response regulator